MCLLSKYGTPRIAKRNIGCYKVLFCDLDNTKWKTPFQDYIIENEVTLGKTSLYPVGNEKIKYSQYTGHYAIEDGFIHTYSTLSGAKMAVRYMFNNLPTYAIFKCIIPKGTSYFPGISGVSFYKHEHGFASKELKFIKILNV